MNGEGDAMAGGGDDGPAKSSDDGPAKSSSEQAFEFQLEEFRSLRKEIELRSDDQRLMERSVILGDAAIYALLNFPKDAGVHLGPFAWVAWYVPSALAFLTLVRWLDSLESIRHIAGYTRGVEQRVLGAYPGGWEMHLFRKRGEVPTALAWHRLLWPILVAGPLVVAGAVHPILPNRAGTMLLLPGIAVLVTLWLLSEPKPAQPAESGRLPPL